MSDNLTIFGTDYTNVAGIKATGTGNGTLTYIRPSGTKSIAANGTGIDVTEYASVNVAVPAQDNTFVVSLIPNESTERFEPDCTYAEALAAVVAGKEIVTKVPPEYNAVGDSLWDSSAQVLMYSVFYSYDSTTSYQDVCTLSSSGITLNYRNTTYHVNGDYYITSSGTHDVTKYASAHVAAGSATASATKGTVSNHSVTVTPSVTRTKGYVTAGTDNGTPVTVSASELVSGTYTVTGSGTADVTNYASASVAAGGATASATKGTVSNHSVTVTPSVTRTAGWVTAGSANGTAVTVSASELVSGSETKTANGTYDVTNLAEVVVDVQGSTPSLHVGFINVQSSYTNNDLTFMNMLGEPTSWAVLSNGTIATSSTATVASVVSDGSSAVGQTITNTSNAQVSYNTGFSETYLADYSVFQVSSSSAQFGGNDGYSLIYTYGGGAIDTKQVQVGSGATSITFTGLEDEPACWYVIFQSNFSTSSGYQRVIAVANDGTDTYGLEMDSSAHYSNAHWSSSYSNGSLTITSQGTNAGGYFHQPGTYLLVYAYDASGNYQSKTVTPSQSTQEVTADSGYDALRKVTVNPIPSEYIVPTGNLAITSNTAAGQSLNVSQYATATVNVPTGGGSVSVDQVTWTNNSTSTVSHQFTGLKGTPKFAVLRCTAQLTRSSNNTYYYIADIIWDGTNAWGNYHLRSNGSFNNVAKTASSGFNVTVSGSSITFSSDATSRSSAPGSFYNSTYELTYVY